MNRCSQNKPTAVDQWCGKHQAHNASTYDLFGWSLSIQAEVIKDGPISQNALTVYKSLG